MSGMLANMLGMGVTVQLLDMFTSTSNTVAKSADKLAGQIDKSAQKANNAWNGMFVGGALAASGGAVVGMLANMGKKSIESSSQLEIFRNQFHVMIKDYQWAEKVYNDSIQFAAKTPFTIPEVVGAAKTLRAFGFQANQIGGELKIAGDWAAMFGERIEKTSEIMGRAMAGGYGRALVYMRGRGVNDKDIREMARQQGTYDDLFDAKGRTKTGYDGNKMIAAMNALLQQKYGGEMEKRMTTLPGMWSNLEDQMIILMSRVGDQFKPRLKKILGGMLDAFSGEQMASLGKAVGQGFDVLLNVLGRITVPLQKAVVWLGQLSDKHPGFVKWATVITAAGGALIFLTGTWLVWIAVSKLWAMSGIVEQFAAARAAVMSFATGPLIGLAIAAYVLYSAWSRNWGGMRDTLTKWWNFSKLVFNAVTEGFSNITNGVVTFSTETYDALESAGITSWVINLMAFAYRLWQVLSGMWSGLMAAGQGFTYLAGAAWMVVKPFAWMLEKGFQLLGFMTGLADYGPANAFNALGRGLGVALGIYLAWNAAVRVGNAIKATWLALTWASNVASFVFAFATMSAKVGLWTMITAMFPATAAVGTFSAALWACPITWIVGAILVLVIGIGVLIWKWREITTWFKQTPQWLQAVMMACMPLVFIPMWIYNNWDKVKKFLAPLGAFFKGIWDDPLNWLWDKIAALTAFFIRSMVKMMQFLPDFLKPGSLKAFDNIDPDKIDGAFVRNMMSNSIDAAKQARLNGSGYVGAAVAGFNAQAAAVRTTAYDKAPVGPPVIIKLDGREIARSVSLHQSAEAATGRTY